MVGGSVGFGEAKMGIKSPSSSSCVLFLGMALFIDVGNCDIDLLGRASEGFDIESEELESHHQPMMMVYGLKFECKVACTKLRTNCRKVVWATMRAVV